jgi:hypothetical protein
VFIVVSLYDGMYVLLLISFQLQLRGLGRWW